MIVDSGDRTTYETGAVRDMKEGKGRCDLMPLNVVAEMFKYDGCTSKYNTIANIYMFQQSGDVNYLFGILSDLEPLFEHSSTMFLEVAKHFEDGAKKYGEHNWEKGIPEWSYIDSAVRHYLKWMRGDDDERHDRAFVWNLMCLIWTHLDNENKEKIGT